MLPPTRVKDFTEGPKDKIHPSCGKFHHIHRYHMDEKRNSSHSKPRKSLKFSSNIAVVYRYSAHAFIWFLVSYGSQLSPINISSPSLLVKSPLSHHIHWIHPPFILFRYVSHHIFLHMIHPPRLRLRPCHREGNGGIYRTIQHQFQPNEGGDRSK